MTASDQRIPVAVAATIDSGTRVFWAHVLAYGEALWELEPSDADTYFGKVLRGEAKGTRLSRAQALKTYFLFLELRHKVEIHNLTGHGSDGRTA